ncbi:MAG: zinc carboxypeptidase, partial [Acidobacteriota bacterium]
MTAYFRFVAVVLLFSTLAVPVVAELEPNRVTLADYLPEGTSYDPNIPRPADVIGFEIGSWHVKHDQVLRYFTILAAASDRLSLEVLGHSHQRKPVLQLIVTSPANHRTLEAIQQRHQTLS